MTTPAEKVMLLSHELCEVKAEHRNLLHERIKPFLNDAKDAIEIQAYGVAVRRIQRVLDLIEKQDK